MWNRFLLPALVLALAISLPTFGAQAEGTMSVLPSFSYFKLGSNDKTTGYSASISSKVNMGMEFDWTLSTDTVKLYVFTTFQYCELSIPDNKSFNASKFGLFGGGVGAGYYVLPDKSLLVSLVHSYQQNLYFRANSVTAIAIDKVALPDVQLRVSYELLKATKLSLNAEAGGNLYFSMMTDTQNFRNGYGGFGRLTGNYDISNTMQLTLGLAFLYAKHNTVQLDQSRAELTALGGMSVFLD